MKRYSLLILVGILLFFVETAYSQSTTKPWTYWWWMGSAVNTEDIDRHLRAFADAGLGGVHIIPIYGAKGYEEQFLPFLGTEWQEKVSYTLEKAEELGLGVDLTLGTGWPFGGPWVSTEHAAKGIKQVDRRFPQTQELNLNLDSLKQNQRLDRLLYLWAQNDSGRRISLTASNIRKGKLRRRVPFGNWTLYGLGTGPTFQKVKRAAPGGEGWVIDYFDEASVGAYLAQFESVIQANAAALNSRAYYHDSYEVYQADWTAGFADKFKQIQGYDFVECLTPLADTAHPDRPFVLHDLRETLAELLHQHFAGQWTQWSKKQGKITRYQAHGSPGNILDLYGLADVPETESFGCSEFAIPGLGCDPDYEEANFGRPSPLMMKFASSPAHLMGKKWVSSETATWLGNHFKVALKQVKPQVDELLISGINHIFYHGMTYSPQQETYPGWLFYASTNFGPSSHFWEELPLLNTYIEQCQTVLQGATPDQDILLYFPIHDLWTDYPGDILLMLDVHKYSKWFGETEFGKLAQGLWDRGYTFDYVSDAQIQTLDFSGESQLHMSGGNRYTTLLIPPLTYLPEKTIAALDSLARQGAHIVFWDDIPTKAPGLAHKKGAPKSFLARSFSLGKQAQVQRAKGAWEALSRRGIKKESLKAQGLDFIRKRTEDGYVYFLSNLGDQFYQEEISLAVEAPYIERFDPITLERGLINPVGGYFDFALAPGESCFLFTHTDKPDLPAYEVFLPGDTLTLNNTWEVAFSFLPFQGKAPKFTRNQLTSWTEWGDEALQAFCGKATYKTTLALEHLAPDKPYRLLFDQVYETASVSLNGRYVGTVWALPFTLDLDPSLFRQTNTLEITVQNLSANRIRDIDSRGLNWKKFYDINFVDIQYTPFDASSWPLQPSGLVGQIRLVQGK